MTCIVGLTKPGYVLFASDSFQGHGYGYRRPVHELEKVFEAKGMLIGGCGYVRDLQIVEFGMDIPPYEFDGEEHYMFRRFIPNLKHALKENGGLCSKNDIETWGSEILVSLPVMDASHTPAMFIVSGDFALTSQLNCAAIGSGEYYARGALAAQTNISDLKTRAMNALKITSELCPTVGPPFNYKILEFTKGVTLNEQASS